METRPCPRVKQPAGWSKKFPLRPEQLRSLGWMIKQEQTTESFVEEEVAESVLPALGLRMDGRARVERLVRGGIIADQAGGVGGGGWRFFIFTHTHTHTQTHHV